MARGGQKNDPEENEQRAATLIEKSDRLAREYSRERDIRLRDDRVRRIDPDDGTQVKTVSLAVQAKESPAPAREPRGKSKQRTADRPAAKEREREEPPPAQRREEKAESRPPPKREEPLPAAAPIAPKPVAPPARSGLDQLAVELEEQLREVRFGWRALPAGDRVTIACAISVAAGVLMPWTSDPAHALRVGLLSGGVVHLAIALASLWLVVRSAAMRGLRMSRRDEQQKQRRISLWLVLLGALSTAAGAYLLLLYGLSKSADWPVELHFGLYWTLVTGTGLSYGGFARFSDGQR